MTYIVTASGTQFDLLNPNPDDIRVEDIASGLSKLCRFTGQCNDFYSVAQHCVLGARELERPHRLAFLLHDASEAYLADISKPLKELLPDYRAIEDRLQAIICEKFSVEYPFSQEVKELDLTLGSTEIRDLSNHGPGPWGEHAMHPTLERKIEPWTWRRAYAEYMTELQVELEEVGYYIESLV